MNSFNSDTVKESLSDLFCLKNFSFGQHWKWYYMYVYDTTWTFMGVSLKCFLWCHVWHRFALSVLNIQFYWFSQVGTLNDGQKLARAKNWNIPSTSRCLSEDTRYEGPGSIRISVVQFWWFPCQRWCRSRAKRRCGDVNEWLKFAARMRGLDESGEKCAFQRSSNLVGGQWTASRRTKPPLCKF